jgi:hypothetical protein
MATFLRAQRALFPATGMQRGQVIVALVVGLLIVLATNAILGALDSLPLLKP